MRDIIESTAQKVNQRSSTNPTGYIYSTTQGRTNGTWHEEMGYGLVDAYASVQAACPPIVNFTGTVTTPIIVTSDTTIVSCGNINVQYVTVTNNATLTLEAIGKISVQNVNAQNNSKIIFDARGGVSLGIGFKVELGSTFKTIKYP